MSRLHDICGVLRGVQLVANASCKYTGSNAKHIWKNSSIKEVVDSNVTAVKTYVDRASKDPSKEVAKLETLIKEAVERPYVVLEGVRQLVNTKTEVIPEQKQSSTARTSTIQSDASDIDISSITLEELEELIAKRSKKAKFRLRVDTHTTAASSEGKSSAKDVQQDSTPTESNSKSFHTHLESEKLIEGQLTKREARTATNTEESYVENVMSLIAGKAPDDMPSSAQSGDMKTDATIALPQLSSVAKQRKVPANRVSRLVSFGTLFAGLGVGTVNELTKGALGLGGSRSVKEAFLSPSNAERIVDTLCRVRGAALKLGQILSIQDSTIVSPELVKAFERVRQAADYMPDWQVDRVMSSELGAEWRKLLKHFEEKPFAAASIGQVHRGVLHDDLEVAIKIQYPGVARSIESDIDNLVGMLKVWDVFPKGFFIDNVVKVAKRELNWEVDYRREAEYTEKFGEMVVDYKEYYVPKVIKHLTTKSVLTTELVPGVPLDKCFNLSYEHRHFIGESVLKLCLRELFEFQCMQTDPNWSNFLFDERSKRLMLIDFGSTRFYSQDFIKNYKNIIIAAANNDRGGVLAISREMGFLTGYESKQMEEAHVDAVMILGQIFRYDGEFDFGKQSMTRQIAQLVPTMVAHRLCPPPEEIYSIHRKLSGIFLLCYRLNIKMNCRNFYEEIIVKNANV